MYNTTVHVVWPCIIWVKNYWTCSTVLLTWFARNVKSADARDAIFLDLYIHGFSEWPLPRLLSLLVS